VDDAHIVEAVKARMPSVVTLRWVWPQDDLHLVWERRSKLFDEVREPIEELSLEIHDVSQQFGTVRGVGPSVRRPQARNVAGTQSVVESAEVRVDEDVAPVSSRDLVRIVPVDLPYIRAQQIDPWVAHRNDALGQMGSL
jgi:hypothetical protein